MERIADENPIVHLSKAKGVQIGKLTKHERDEQIRPFESPEQLDRFLAVALQPSYAPYGRAWEVMARCGLRPSEAYALKPGDLDLTAKTVRVERALDLDRSVKATKTHETRTVRLSATAVESLKKHLTWLKTETLRRDGANRSGSSPTSRMSPCAPTPGRKVSGAPAVRRVSRSTPRMTAATPMSVGCSRRGLHSGT